MKKKLSGQVGEEVLHNAQAAFFKAMCTGYASGDGNTKTERSESGNSKKITITVGSYTVVDEWHTTPYSDFSAGTTTIIFEDSPVWWMSYGGYYREEVIPFLKESIGTAYKLGQFLGGRGPSMRIAGPYTYFNSTESFDFSSFEGEEKIVRTETGELLGFHKFFGMALI